MEFTFQLGWKWQRGPCSHLCKITDVGKMTTEATNLGMGFWQCIQGCAKTVRNQGTTFCQGLREKFLLRNHLLSNYSVIDLPNVSIRSLKCEPNNVFLLAV